MPQRLRSLSKENHGGRPRLSRDPDPVLCPHRRAGPLDREALGRRKENGRGVAHHDRRRTLVRGTRLLVRRVARSGTLSVNASRPSAATKGSRFFGGWTVAAIAVCA